MTRLRALAVLLLAAQAALLGVALFFPDVSPAYRARYLASHAQR